MNNDEEKGKIIIAAPSDAVRIADYRPDYAERVFTFGGLEKGTVYVVDLDLVFDIPNPFIDD
jgi:hypothetical protein